MVAYCEFLVIRLTIYDIINLIKKFSLEYNLENKNIDNKCVA